jgi:putative endonuclease
VTKVHLRGRLAERFAAAYLQARGLKLLTKNFRYRHGEIDLVMEDGDTIVFVEVRLRGPGSRISAADSVTPAKQRHLIGTARAYLLRRPIYARHPCRFDVILFDAPDYCPQWIRGAFDALE